MEFERAPELLPRAVAVERIRRKEAPERGVYAPFEAWVSYQYLAVVQKTPLEFTIRHISNRLLSFSPPNRGTM